MGLLATLATEEETGASLWTIYELSSDHMWYKIESIKIVSESRKPR